MSAWAALRSGARYQLEGERGLHDHSSAPRRVANRTARSEWDAILRLLQLGFTAPEIADMLGIGVSTLSGILTRTSSDD